MSQASGSDRLLVPISERDHIKGAINAPAVLVVYGDYQCPQGGRLDKMIEEIRQQLGVGAASPEENRLCFVFRHFPQTQLHPQAQKAAEAAEAAGAQGKFWQMHDTLFEHQQALDNGSLVEYANELEIDILQFLQDMSEHVYASRVNEDVESGRKSSVTNAPALFINGVRYKDAWELERLVAAIVEALNSQQT
jgi:protein-disulfide isomerase